MTEQTQTPGKTPSAWQRFVAGLPTGLALLLIGLVWLAGAVWSFEEQTRYAQANGFEIPQLLPLVLDGMAVAMAAVAWAASLDARPAVFARLGTAVAIGASAASNGSWAWTRSAQDVQTVVLAAGVPVVAMLAFEVLLAEVRRQVLRRRGQPGPVAVTYPRLIRVALAPWSTLRTWRRLVLEATDPRRAFEDHGEPTPAEQTTAEPDRQTQPDPAPVPDRAPDTAPLPQTPAPRRAPARRSGPGRQTPPVRLVGSGDEEVLAQLRQWQTANGGRVPSIDQTQQIAGGGRSRAIRLRGLLSETAEEADRVAV